MKLSHLYLSAAFMAATPAIAADAVIYDPVPMLPAAVYDWSGIYIGVNAGYGGGTFEHPFRADVDLGDESVRLLDGSLDVTSSGFVGGAQVGYNFQHGNFVYGLEVDIQASGIEGEVSGNIDVNPDVFDVSARAKAGTKLDYFGTIRARLGYVPVERLLVYGTGGFAYGRTESYIQASIDGDNVLDERVKNTSTGWTIGAGAEYAFTDNWSLKSEYLYTDLGKETLASGSILGPISGKLESDVSFHVVRVGLNYKF